MTTHHLKKLIQRQRPVPILIPLREEVLEYLGHKAAFGIISAAV